MKLKFFSYFLCLLLFACDSEIIKETVETYPDGSPKVIRYYKENGKERKLIKETLYYSNHQKYMEGGYKEGKRNGKWSSWHQNGNKWSEGNFVDGIDDGERTVYHENGEKYFQGTYKNGKKTGVWKFWDDKGELVKKENYN
ncbi:MAG: hypothetical protein WC401_00095 [Bacteroidales bacterium]|jgi:antitoxin component YwqK of YwqJK toxin-antitoxin module|nr:hypothetical protein [Bacteroidales bacterium]